MVCANKVDLEHLREVTKDEGEAFALKTGAVYIETRYVQTTAWCLHVMKAYASFEGSTPIIV